MYFTSMSQSDQLIGTISNDSVKLRSCSTSSECRINVVCKDKAKANELQEIELAQITCVNYCLSGEQKHGVQRQDPGNFSVKQNNEEATIPFGICCRKQMFRQELSSESSDL